MESDWKKFRAMLEIWHERYLADRNARLARMLSHSEKSETERFWDAEEQIQKEAKTLRALLRRHFALENVAATDGDAGGWNRQARGPCGV